VEAPRLLTILFVGVALVGPGDAAVFRAQDLPADTSGRALSRSFQSLTSPPMEQRKALRRTLQQQGYANTLYDLVRTDPLSALLSYARVHAQIEWSVPHTGLFLYVPVLQPPPRDHHLPGFTGAPSSPWGIPLYDDWTFPVDPWARP
jgi:hypothetical protein